MNRTTEHDRQQHEKRQRPAATEPDRMASKPQEKTGAPEAVQAAKVAGRTSSAKSTTSQEARRAQGVDWVRPTDLMNRHSAALAGRGIDFELELARRTRAPIKAGARHLSERARRLPDLSEFGRGSRSPSWVSRSGIGLG